MRNEIRIQRRVGKYLKRCRLLGLTAEKLESTKTGVSKDGWENLSEIPHPLGNVKVWWSYRVQPDSLGNTAAVQRREDADHIEIGQVSVAQWDEAECPASRLTLSSH